MRLTLTNGAWTLLELVLFERDDDDDEPAPAVTVEPGAVHDLSTGHEIGFGVRAGWTGPDHEAPVTRQ